METGLSPSFWLLAADQEWLPEISVMAMRGDQPNVTNMGVYYLNSDGTDGSATSQWTGPDFRQAGTPSPWTGNLRLSSGMWTESSAGATLTRRIYPLNPCI